MSQIVNDPRRLGADLRERRKGAGLSQLEAAAAAGIGRSTLIHLEQGGRNVNLSSVLAVADVVGAVVGVQEESGEQIERRRLRADEQMQLGRRRESHLALALDLALRRRNALEALEDARRMVELWKRNRTCSSFYIDAWSKILKGDAERVAKRIRDIDPQWLDAMLQNTPFSRALAAK
jgi:transcriptional regulator with XRE-family HTH domain